MPYSRSSKKWMKLRSSMREMLLIKDQEQPPAGCSYDVRDTRQPRVDYKREDLEEMRNAFVNGTVIEDLQNKLSCAKPTDDFFTVVQGYSCGGTFAAVFAASTFQNRRRRQWKYLKVTEGIKNQLR